MESPEMSFFVAAHRIPDRHAHRFIVRELFSGMLNNKGIMGKIGGSLPSIFQPTCDPQKHLPITITLIDSRIVNTPFIDNGMSLRANLACERQAVHWLISDVAAWRCSQTRSTGMCEYVHHWHVPRFFERPVPTDATVNSSVAQKWHPVTSDVIPTRPVIP